MKFVTGAAGRRDDYQVPIALADAGLLSRHVTDVYAPDLLMPLLGQLGAWGLKARRRHSAGLPSRLVHVSRRLALQKATAAVVPTWRHRLQGDQNAISLSALRQAQQHQAALLLYAGYAYQAFTAEAPSVRPRALFQYHPHIRDSAAILRADAERYPFMRQALDQLERDEQDPTNLPELEIANLVICNSTFTAATCLSLGIEASKVRVIPYGIERLPEQQQQRSESGSHCRFLFVGTGIQRKGLHHLLLAWKRARLSHSQLQIVSRTIDPEIRSAIDPGENVIWLNSVSNQQLDRLYQQSEVFVLPSLIEGFGYVYLEAMARGCFCIGTPNTGLPNIGDEHCRQIVEAGEPDRLAEALKAAEARWAQQAFDHSSIARRATQRNWAAFRQDVVQAVRGLSIC